MVVTPSGRRISIRALRKCEKCGVSTWHLCSGIRYEKSERAADWYMKRMYWNCMNCGQSSEELKEVPEPTERSMLLKRLLEVGEVFLEHNHTNEDTRTGKICSG